RRRATSSPATARPGSARTWSGRDRGRRTLRGWSRRTGRVPSSGRPAARGTRRRARTARRRGRPRARPSRGSSGRSRSGLRSRRDGLAQEDAYLVELLEPENRLLERLDVLLAAGEEGVFAELRPHLVHAQRVLGAAPLVRQLGLEHTAVPQRDPHAAGERGGIR